MAWYNTGTVAVAATKVTGTGTNFLDSKFGIGAGQAFLLPGSGTVKIYEIASVEDATHLTLKTTAGTVAAGAAYAVMSFYTDSVPDFAKRLAAQLSYYQSQMDGWQTIMTGTGTVTVAAPDGTVVNISSFAKLTSDISRAYLDGGNLGTTIFPNNLGNTADFNIYYQTANANAVIANGYPIAKAGTLYVTKSAYGCQQMYITFQGEVFVRGLTATFNPAAPNWSDWWPIFTGKSTIPVANGGTGATTAVAARTALGAAATGANTFSGTQTMPAIEISGVTNPFIDFHYSNDASDYTSRIIMNDANALTVMGKPLDGANSFRCRRGIGGVTLNTNPFNFYWNDANLEAWIQTTQVGNVTLAAVSDKALKSDIAYMDENPDMSGVALAEVLQWRTATFKYKARGVLEESDTQLGFIANDLVLVSPECVKGEGLKDGWDENNPEDAYYLNEIALIAKLTDALQTQQEQIEALQRDVMILTQPQEQTS
ncbi:pyocin knob domain-containing S74 family peptidase [Rahnella sp. PCH160]|uniref:pyocin knob domain-containing S74 family peptidase n=1 Tax=Rahnella sp. PCH160 TaxID=3447928 RepID=UPI0039FB93F0